MDLSSSPHRSTLKPTTCGARHTIVEELRLQEIFALKRATSTTARLDKRLKHTTQPSEMFILHVELTTHALPWGDILRNRYMVKIFQHI